MSGNVAESENAGFGRPIQDLGAFWEANLYKVALRRLRVRSRKSELSAEVENSSFSRPVRDLAAFGWVNPMLQTWGY